MRLTTPALLRCWWCDRTTGDTSSVHVGPFGHLRCRDCADHDTPTIGGKA